jgi:hypothetical protein
MKIKLLTAIFALFVFAGIGFAQNTDSKMKKMDMKMGDKPEMSEMMNSPQHKLMKAYHQNIVTFAKTLQEMSKDSQNVDADLAKMSVSEIKRSSEMMDKIHTDHMSKMDSAMKKKMAPMMENMKTKKAELDHHIMELDKSVSAASINAKDVEKHASAIVEMLDGMKMDGGNKDKMKMDHKMDMKDHKMDMKDM